MLRQEVLISKAFIVLFTLTHLRMVKHSSTVQDVLLEQVDLVT